VNTKQEDFIYNSVKNGCLKAGLSESASSDQGEIARVKYKRGQFSGKPLDLITSQITAAKAINKKTKGKK